MKQSPLEANSHSVNKFPTFYGTQFTTMSTRVRHW